MKSIRLGLPTLLPAIWCAVLTAVGAHAQADTNLVVEADGLRFERIISGDPLYHDPSFSPDGEWIAYVSTETKERCVWVARPDGSERRQVTRASTGGWSGDYYPNWFPDGERIAFVSDRGGVARIWSVPVHGGDPEALTGNLHLSSVASGGFDISPDGKQLVYAAGQDSGIGLFLQSIDGSEVRTLTTNQSGNRYPTFSPDGQTIAFTSDRGDTMQIWTMPVMEGQPQHLPQTNGFFWSSWSPDGRWIATQRDKQIFLIPTDGGAPISVMRESLEGWVPRWSPDGTRLVITGSLNRSRLETLDLETGDIVELSQTDGLQSYPLSWSPDGDHIAFQFSLHEIGSVPSTGGDVEILGGGTDESWADINWSADGETFAFVAAPRGLEGEVDDSAFCVWTMPVSGGDPQQVTLTKGFLPHISPDGAWIAYITFDEDDGVRIVPSSGGLPRVLSLGEGTHLLAGWSE
ncbi:MAG: hypothetical protein HOC05_13150, partial [Gemmatimonadetes bacterium]|nr:hypothetical protein [Gemmatimonadota bacterium]